jgi:hypothetical protein
MKAKTLIILGVGFGLWYMASKAAKNATTIIENADARRNQLQGIDGFGKSFKRTIRKATKTVTRVIRNPVLQKVGAVVAPITLLPALVDTGFRKNTAPIYATYAAAGGGAIAANAISAGMSQPAVDLVTGQLNQQIVAAADNTQDYGSGNVAPVVADDTFYTPETELEPEKANPSWFGTVVSDLNNLFPQS